MGMDGTKEKVYQDTTRPFTKTSTPYYNRNDKSDLGPTFVAPDDGWAWVVCVAAGISNLSIYPCLQQFGFLFREQLSEVGLTTSQITAIINTNPAISACTGLLNGPMFRRFTFRQVGMTGALLVSSGIALTAFCDTFLGFMITYAMLYGFGMGISVSASSLAINTYFQKKRRKAAGFSWTITGLGPIFLPYLVTFLLGIYGVRATVLLFAAISLHAFVSALIYQPVRYHLNESNKEQLVEEQPQLFEDQVETFCPHCGMQRKHGIGGIFSSQYLYQDDDAQHPGYEITEPGTPMLSRANDGWYGSRQSLASSRLRLRTVSSSKDLEHIQHLHIPLEEEQQQTDEFLRPNNFRREREEINMLESQTCCKCSALQEVKKETETETAMMNNGKMEAELIETQKNMSCLQKVVTFFDLDLLKDFTYVNLVAGLTIINFTELNFSILMPFILADFGFTVSQTTLAIAILAGLDITVRFLGPFFTEKINWDNRIFFLIGVIGMALGRTVVACTRSYNVILGSFVWIGICKGIRTIFWPLIIPSYVPLHRLPGASGLQLLISGLFTLLGGPFVGMVRDRYNYSVTLHCLDMLSFIAAISWTLEAIVRRRIRQKAEIIQ